MITKIAVSRTITLLAFFTLSFTFVASTTFGQKNLSPENDQATLGSAPTDSFKSFEPDPGQDSQPQVSQVTQEPRRFWRKRRQPAKEVSTPSPTPSVAPTPPALPALMDAQAAKLAAARASPSLTPSSSSAPMINPAGSNSILPLPVALGLFALALIALIVTVTLLRKELRRSSNPWS